MPRQTRRSCNLSEAAYQRVTKVAELYGISHSSVLEAVIACKLDDIPLAQSLEKGTKRPPKPPSTDCRGGGICMF
jgi:hypothetical protein